MKTTKFTVTPEYLQQYCQDKFSKLWDLSECANCIDLAIRRGAKTKKGIIKEAIIFLYC